MKRFCGALLVLCAMLVVGRAFAAPRRPTTPNQSSPDDWRKNVENARSSGKYTFCSTPRKPVLGRALGLCSLAEETPDCDGFAQACHFEPPKPPPSWFIKLLESLGGVAKVLVWMLVGVIVLAILYPVIRGIMNAHRDKRLADQKAKPNVAVAFTPPPPPEPETITDAEAALRAADALARAGEHERALGLYLAASLAALGRRGAIRLGKDRTNGEYVRGCNDPQAKQPLREIVREVDRATFGHKAPDAGVVQGVAARATALVRHIALVALVLFACGCGALRGGGPNDPAGDELPVDVLERSGFQVSRLGRSIASLPMPSESHDRSLFIVDVTRVQLEEETSAHLMRFIEDGGHVAIFGPAALWPKELEAKMDGGGGAEIDVGDGWVTGARVSSSSAITWSGSTPIARIGKGVFAATKYVGRGLVLGVASDDFLTNVGVARPDNAAALVGILTFAGETQLKIARPEDGIPPPDGPFAALGRAGLLKGTWHAIAACLVLFLAYGIRHARAKPVTPPARRAFAEHVEANGALYMRTKAWSLALASYARYAETRMRERVPRGQDPATFIASRTEMSREEVQKIWARAMAATPDAKPVGDELQTIRDLRVMLASWRLGRAWLRRRSWQRGPGLRRCCPRCCSRSNRRSVPPRKRRAFRDRRRAASAPRSTAS